MISIEKWTAPKLPAKIQHGDMPGDKVHIEEVHIKKANTIFPTLLKMLGDLFETNTHAKAVVSVYGGSGVGKSEIASILSYYLKNSDIGNYILSGDNYPHRIPMYNDAERLRIYRYGGVNGLIAKGEYTPQRIEKLQKLQIENLDSDPTQADSEPWLSTYQQVGYLALKSYLGTKSECNFEVLSSIIKQFKNGTELLWLKRMGREPQQLWYEQINLSNAKVLLLEWTHGNNENLHGVDIPIYLYSTPEQTLAHRKKRKRDSNTDSAFTHMVLRAEQELLETQRDRALIIVD